MGVQHFETLFQEDKPLYLSEIMKVAKNFPTSVSNEENDELMVPVTLKEIQSVLTLSKNDKIPSPDGIPVEVYRALFDVLGLDLLRVVEDSRKSGKIPAVFNSTFIVLIPKSDLPKPFEYLGLYPCVITFTRSLVRLYLFASGRYSIGIYQVNNLVFSLVGRFMMQRGLYRKVCIPFTVIT